MLLLTKDSKAKIVVENSEGTYELPLINFEISVQSSAVAATSYEVRGSTWKEPTFKKKQEETQVTVKIGDKTYEGILSTDLPPVKKVDEPLRVKGCFDSPFLDKLYGYH